jgi:hypothetical protein
VKSNLTIFLILICFGNIRCSEIEYADRSQKQISVSSASLDVFIVSGAMTLDNIKVQHIKKLYFTNNSVLTTEGKDATLEVDEIESEGGTLRTFSESDQAPIAHDGLPSGHLHFRAGKINGSFTIEIRGQRGGAGFKGAQGGIGTTGAPNLGVFNAAWLMGYMVYVCREDYYNLNRNRCDANSYQECRLKRHPGVGGKGGPGTQGFQGHPGFKGGDVQDSVLEIPPENQNVKVIFEPGAPGPGGMGGEGGPGGPGGSGAAITNNSPGMPCDPSPQGPTGDSGPEGPIGPPGFPGNKETLTLNGLPL